MSGFVSVVRFEVRVLDTVMQVWGPHVDGYPGFTKWDVHVGKIQSFWGSVPSDVGSLCLPNNRTSHSSAQWQLPPSLLPYFNRPSDLKFHTQRPVPEGKKPPQGKEMRLAAFLFGISPQDLRLVFFFFYKKRSLNYNSLKPILAGSSGSPHTRFSLALPIKYKDWKSSQPSLEQHTFSEPRCSRF